MVKGYIFVMAMLVVSAGTVSFADHRSKQQHPLAAMAKNCTKDRCRDIFNILQKHAVVDMDLIFQALIHEELILEPHDSATSIVLGCDGRGVSNAREYFEKGTGLQYTPENRMRVMRDFAVRVQAHFGRSTEEMKSIEQTYEELGGQRNGLTDKKAIQKNRQELLEELCKKGLCILDIDAHEKHHLEGAESEAIQSVNLYGDLLPSILTLYVTAN